MYCNPRLAIYSERNQAVLSLSLSLSFGLSLKVAASLRDVLYNSKPKIQAEQKENGIY